MNYYVKRLLHTILTFIAAVTIAFVLYRALPGGPVDSAMAQLIADQVQSGQPVDMKEVQTRAERLTGIDPGKPVYVAYVEWWADIILHQDFGISIRYNQPVFDVLFAAMPWTIFLSVNGLIFGLTTSLIIGALQAYWEGSKFDEGMTLYVLTTNAIPYYVVAIVLLAVFAYEWGLFPTGGRTTEGTQPGVNLPWLIGVVHHAALPIGSGFVLGFGGSLALRANAIQVMGSNYLRSAEIRGVNTLRITTRYVARNAILPIYTGIMIGISGIFSGSVILEQIFTYPGVGWYTFGALLSRDYPLLMGTFVFYTAITFTGIMIADLTYGLVDPRAETGASREEF